MLTCWFPVYCMHCDAYTTAEPQRVDTGIRYVCAVCGNTVYVECQTCPDSEPPPPK